MRRLIVALALIFSASVVAQTAAPPLTVASVVLSVVRIALNLGSGKQDYIQVEVVSEGATEEQARAEGFRSAINQAIGSVVATQTETQNQRLVRNEIVNYSSGFVDRYEVIEREQVGNQVRLKMRVWVAESKIAHRLLSQGFSLQTVPGPQLAAQAQTLLEERQRGDQLVAAIMRDFPHRAFDIIAEQGRMSFNNRVPRLEVPVTVRWNPNFVSALREALALTKDPAKPWLVYNTANLSNPAIQISALDSAGRVISRTCQVFTFSPETTGHYRPPRYLLSMRGNQLWIDSAYSVSGTLGLEFPNNPDLIQHIGQIRAEILASSKCGVLP